MRLKQSEVQEKWLALEPPRRLQELETSGRGNGATHDSRGEMHNAAPPEAAAAAPVVERRLRFKEEIMEVGAMQSDSGESHVTEHHGMAVADEAVSLQTKLVLAEGHLYPSELLRIFSFWEG
eukprot:1290915-Amphidinium_carterae.1